MFSKTASSLLILMLFTVAIPCPAQSTDKKKTMTAVEIMARAAEAHAKNKRLIVKLKTGRSVSGLVSPSSDSDRFLLTHTHGLFGVGDSVTIPYADVASVKGRNPFVKALKGIASVPIVIAGAAAIVTVCPISELIKRPVCPRC